MEDLRQFISPSTHLCCNPNFPEPLLSAHHCTSAVTAAPSNSYEPIMVSHGFYSPGLTQFAHDYSSSTVIPTTDTTVAVTASDHDATPFFSLKEKPWFGFDAGNNRWPRQETQSLLEIRSRLDSKFRETNHKGPLWNEISRIMVEEYGYQRSGKKCKEKFENLYKYYKKTSKEGKSGRTDGKHYRFFSQLEAIYGETNTHARNISFVHETPSSTNNQTSGVFSNHKGSDQSLSLSKSSEFETSSSENNEEDLSAIALMMGKQKHKREGKGRVRRKSLRVIVEGVVESHMRNIIEAQDAWMEKVLSVVEQRDKDMVYKEEERKKKEAILFDKKVYELWAKERAWVEARDAALMEVVKKKSGREFQAEVIIQEAQNYKNKRQANDAKEYPCEDADHRRKWTEMEISNLIQLRFGFDQRFQENGYLENGQWDDIAAKMVCLGHNKSATDRVQANMG